MSESRRDRWLSIGMSVLLHGTLIALLAVGVWRFRHPPAPAQNLSINATVVDARTLKGVGAAPTPTPSPKPAPPPTPVTQPAEGPPPPTPDEQAMRQQAAKAEAEHEAQAQQELLARQQAKQAREQKEQQQAAAAAAAQAAEARKTAQAKQLAREKKEAAARKAAKRAAEKKAAELAAQKKAAKLAAQKRAAELAAQKKAAELAAQRAAAARAARVAELQQSLQEDQQAAAASGALAGWTGEIQSRIENAWIKPPTARKGLKCVLNVGLVPGGAVTGVSIGQCNGDDAVRQSIQTAVYNASPLPPPPNGIAFPHQLTIIFKPDE